MINPVNGYGTNSYSVPPANVRSETGTDQAFSLDRGGDEGVLYEKSTDRKEESAGGGRRDAADASFGRQGVRLELSSEGKDRASTAARESVSILERISDLVKGISGIWGRISAAVARFWNGEKIGENESAGEEQALQSVLGAESEAGEMGVGRDGAAGAGGTAGAGDTGGSAFGTDSISDGASGPLTAEAARRLLHPPNDAESIQRFMSGYDGRKLAKNSDLLTYYDRRGQHVELDASDKRKILQGTSGEMKS